jgi:hypothetical protein
MRSQYANISLSPLVIQPPIAMSLISLRKATRTTRIGCYTLCMVSNLSARVPCETYTDFVHQHQRWAMYSVSNMNINATTVSRPHQLMISKTNMFN